MQGWKDKTLTIDQHPRCKAYLASMWIKQFQGMNDYWCAAAIAESFSDKRLKKLGTVNFNTMTGTQLLDAFEDILAGSAKKPKDHAKKSLSPRPKYRKQQTNQPKAA
ncbi:hypothetical protein HWX16_16380 [Ochrobactrum intermedium]|uniref:hypothetical protein n=1 Tax=Brucella intermedia TaxID=94625 RepID=UPI00159C3787|nr:hypothetical protein [Brucella intermedia]NVM41906.1 hypothetical protein [Brucella intermedia]